MVVEPIKASEYHNPGNSIFFYSIARYFSSIARSNEILGWEGVGNRQLLCFFKA
jgi:hypothetical protein